MQSILAFLVVFVLSTLFLIGCVPLQSNTSLEKLSDEEFTSLLEEQGDQNIIGKAAKPPLLCEDDGENLIFTRGEFRRLLPKFFCTDERGGSQRERLCRTSGFTSVLTYCEQGCNLSTGRCRAETDLYIEHFAFVELQGLSDSQIYNLFYANYAPVWDSLNWSRLYGAINVTIVNTRNELVYTDLYFFRNGIQIGPLGFLGRSLSPGENQFHHPLFSSVLPYSIQNISVFVDPRNIIEEINESNNNASINVN